MINIIPKILREKPKKKKLTKKEWVRWYAESNDCSESWVYKQLQWGKIKM